jgi:hypothetical protein
VDRGHVDGAWGHVNGPYRDPERIPGFPPGRATATSSRGVEDLDEPPTSTPFRDAEGDVVGRPKDLETTLGEFAEQVKRIDQRVTDLEVRAHPREALAAPFRCCGG